MRTTLLLLGLSLAAFLPLSAQQEDTVNCNRVFSYAFEHKLIVQPIGTIVSTIGKEFLGKPYEAHTLDTSPGEHIVTNLHSFDCVTFIENVLALARCIKSNRLSFGAYREELIRLRYRRGAVTDFSSRLNYFSEWIRDNESKGYVQDVTQQLGGSELQKKIAFMTEHKQAYLQLGADSIFIKLKSIEERLSALKLIILPKARIQSAEASIHDGDIIAITTSIAGLDVTHTGIAVRTENGELHFMHAPDVGGNVKISTEPLGKYVGKGSKNSGIIIARPVDITD